MASQHSYVMRLGAAELARLREQGADIGTHLRQGEDYYARILGSAG